MLPAQLIDPLCGCLTTVYHLLFLFGCSCISAHNLEIGLSELAPVLDSVELVFEDAIVAIELLKLSTFDEKLVLVVRG